MLCGHVLDPAAFGRHRRCDRAAHGNAAGNCLRLEIRCASRMDVALCIVMLSITGFYIGSPFFGAVR